MTVKYSKDYEVEKHAMAVDYRQPLVKFLFLMAMGLD